MGLSRPTAFRPPPSRWSGWPAAGFSLWELLCALGVASVVLAVSLPAFQNFVLDGRRAADVNALVAAVQFARSEAEKRGRPVVLCKSRDFQSCAGPGAGFDTGWMVVLHETGSGLPALANGVSPLHAYRPRLTGEIHANREWFEFRPFHRRSTNGTVTFCDRRGSAAARAVIVSYTGRPRVSAEGPGGRALECPGAVS
jgi:type IV fimbrial biogenesis protein FimT